jgi:hypothetical protein
MHADEAKVVGKLIEEGLAMGYAVSVSDGEDGTQPWVVSRSTNKSEIIDAMGSTDMDRVRFHDGETIVGTFLMIYGNEPYYVISDYTNNPRTREIFGKVEPLIAELEDLDAQSMGF